MHARRGDGGRDERVRIAEHGGREKEPRQRELKHVLRVSVKLLNKKNPVHTIIHTCTPRAVTTHYTAGERSHRANRTSHHD